MADKGFPCNWTSRLLCALPKNGLWNRCPRFHLVFGRAIRQCGKEVFYFKCRGDKSQTKETDQGKKKKKRKLKNQEETRTRRRERSDKGANKETARKTGKHFQNQWDWGWKESRSEETLGCRRCMWLWGKKTGIVSWWWEHHTVQAETETYLGGGGEAGDKCCLETGKED